MGEQVKLQVHHVRFFEKQPQTINCISFDYVTSKVAVSRSDGSVEIYSACDNWFQEMVFPGGEDASVESLLWAQGRLFAAGLSGNLVELDLKTNTYLDVVSSNAGPIWCLTKNAKEDQIAAGTEDGCVVLFELSDELQYLRGFGKQEGRILCITWHNYEDENVIVTGGTNNIRQWSVKSGQPISRMSLGRQYNKDTIVWCVAVTKDFTIISGDSRGVVTFWNGKESTQLKTFHSHKADVLSLCLSEDEEKVFTGGVDASLFQFSLCIADPTSDRKRWVQQVLHNRHSHDIRALAYRDGRLISGGVDTFLLIADLKGQKAVREVAPFHPQGLVNIAEERNLIQLQYNTYIEIWQLGAAAAPFAETRGILPLTQKPIKLVQLQARKEQQIICSAMSPQGLVAFSDTKGVRLYSLHLNKEDSSLPQVTLTRMKAAVPGPARQMTFTADNQSLVIVSMSGKLQVISVETGQIKHSFKSPSEAMVHRISVSSDSSQLAVATLDHGVHLYQLSTGQFICSCPNQASQVSALAFSPHRNALLIAYCNQKLYEFDIEKKEYTSWCRENSDKFPTNWLKPWMTIDRITFQPDQSEHVVFNTNKSLCVLNRAKSLTEEKSEKTQPRKSHKMEAVHSCLKYRFLVFADFLSNGMLVVVERPPPAIAESLPPSLKMKKFGVS